MKKTLKKLTCGMLAAISVFGCAATLTACETSHPEAKMQIEFDGETYTLEYKLYRKVAPATVEHFIYLVDNGYYNGLCVHDYSDSRMYTGSYSVSAENPTSLVYKKYYDAVKGYKNFKEYPHSVWFDDAKSTDTLTLKGEFESNGFYVESGALKEQFGSLAMYYYDVDDYEEAAATDVYTAQAEGKEVNKADYKYNMTTSTFFISLSETEKTNNAYCTFATLKKDSKDELADLQEAIADYIDEHYGNENEEEFTTAVSTGILEDDALLGDHSIYKEFDVPAAPIVVKKVSITKY